MLNYIVLIGGLLAIAILWNVISPPERKKETRIVSTMFVVLGIVVYILQSTFFS